MSRFVNKDRLMQFAEMLTDGRDAFLMEVEPARVFQACKNRGLGPDSFGPALERALVDVIHKAQIVKNLFEYAHTVKTTFEQTKYLYEVKSCGVDEEVSNLLVSLEAAQIGVKNLQISLQIELMNWVNDASEEIMDEIQEGRA